MYLAPDMVCLRGAPSGSTAGLSMCGLLSRSCSMCSCCMLQGRCRAQTTGHATTANKQPSTTLAA